jgi:hypothetical protein
VGILLLFLLLASPFAGSQSLPQQPTEQQLQQLSNSELIELLSNNLTAALALVSSLQANLVLQVQSYSQRKSAYDLLKLKVQSLDVTIVRLSANLTTSDNSLTQALKDLKIAQEKRDSLQLLLTAAEQSLENYKSVVSKQEFQLALMGKGFRITTYILVPIASTGLGYMLGGSKWENAVLGLLVGLGADGLGLVFHL